MARLLILGAGGFAAAVAEVVHCLGTHEIVGFLDDRYPGLAAFEGLPVWGRLDELRLHRHRADAASAALGLANLRRRAAEHILTEGLDWISLIHPRAFVSPSARLGRGVIVMAGAVVGTRCTIDDGALINAGAVLDHDVHVGAFAHLAVGACAGGGAVLEPDAMVGVGVAVAPGCRYPTPGG